jgi:23S rRNA (adenine2503-C2)-methyltransferase
LNQFSSKLLTAVVEMPEATPLQDRSDMADATVVQRRHLLEMSRGDLAAWLSERGQRGFRADQIRKAVFGRRVDDFAAMSDLPAALRAELAAELSLYAGTVAARRTAADGTEKLLLRFADGDDVECVLMFEDDRTTACISTQVGCAMGCVFCASGLDGVTRSLTAGEVLEQLVHARNRLPAEERISHIVVMGMGEPLANLDNVLAALDVATSPAGLGVSARHVHISTVGLPAMIRKLARSGKPYHLAVSLHAPDDQLRNRIVPTNESVGLGAILEAADSYQAETGRQVTYEYVLLGGVNDAPDQAEMLGRLLKGRRAHVNLIPFNDVSGLPYRGPGRQALSQFVEALRRHGVSVKTRKRKGADIDAACGQLRRAALAGQRADGGV